MTTCEAALMYAEAGWKVFPLWGIKEGICTCHRKDECPFNTRGKHPLSNLVKHGLKDATTDKATIRSWFTKYPNANLALITGSTSGFFVVDIDPRNGGEESLQKLEEEHGTLPETLIQDTGGGGYHYFFRIPQDRIIRSKSNALGAGIDIKGENSYVVVAPSRHMLGVYEWQNWGQNIENAPEYIFAALVDAHSADLSLEEDKEIPEGERHNTLLHFARKLIEAGFGRQMCLDELKKIRDTRCRAETHKIEDEELEKILDDSASYMLPRLPWNDIGLGKTFAYLHGDNLLHHFITDVWYVWQNGVWQVNDAKVERYLKQTISRLKTYSYKMTGKNASAFRKFVTRAGNRTRIEAALKMARSEPAVAVRIKELDQHPLLLNCKNGVLNLKTLELQPHNKKLLMTRQAPVDYVPNTQSERWEKFLDEATQGDETQKRYLQLAAGYSLTGSTREEKVFFIVGPGGTGKSTFVEALRTAMGDYASVVSSSAFLASRRDYGESPRPEIASLPGRRLAISSEIPSGARIADTFKTVGSADPIRVRTLYSKPFEFQPQFKLWMTMNSLPQANYQDTGIFRRVVVIEFNFKPSEPDPTLKAAFKNDPEQHQAILAWATRGAKAWLAGEKLRAPEAIKQATQQYRESQDPFKDWIEECCSLAEDDCATSGDLWNSFRRWADTNRISLARAGLRTHKAFAIALRREGFEKEVRSLAGSTKNVWNGIALRKESNF